MAVILDKLVHDDVIPWETEPVKWMKMGSNMSFDTATHNKMLAKRLIVRKFYSTLQPAQCLELFREATKLRIKAPHSETLELYVV